MSDQMSSAHGPIVETHGIHGGQDENHHGAHGHDVHVTPTRHYIYVFLALCFLTTLSFCTYFDWWRANFTPAESRMLMMAVSCSKALLVILFFMHILWEANWKYVLTIPAAIMSMFLILMLIPDVGNRMRHQSDERKFNAAEPRAEKHPPAEKPPAAYCAMSSSAAISVDRISHWYGQRQALAEVSFEVQPAEIFVFLGPNGGGKSTLFRLLSTLLPLEHGEATELGLDLRRQIADIRARIGIVFQSPSVDRKLTVGENLMHQGHLYGLRGDALKERSRVLLEKFKLTDRVRDKVETLSGGLRRRVELAKGLLHQPQLLLLDEPSTGLDPAARIDLWDYLRAVART